MTHADINNRSRSKSNILNVLNEKRYNIVGNEHKNVKLKKHFQQKADFSTEIKISPLDGIIVLF